MNNAQNGPPPQQIVMQMLQGKIVSKALTLVADLAVADHMTSAPTCVEKLATATGTHAESLYRVLRALAGLGVFAESEGRAFALTPISRLLRSDTPGSLRGMARWFNLDSHHTAWGELEHSVKTGRPAFDEAHGMPVFEYFGKHADDSRIFDEAMGSFTSSAAIAVAKAYDFSSVKHLVDVGGSQGVLLSGVLDQFPQVRGTLFDLPHVIEGARPVLAAGRHRDRIEAIAGSFLDGVPEGADAYIMKSIVHDWDDAHCVTLLSNCRKAMAPGARVLIVEGIVTDAPDAAFLKLLDLEMLVMTTGGRERTRAEFGALLQKAGLELTRVVATESPVSIIEAHAGSPGKS
jgi:hypothetical protein